MWRERGRERGEREESEQVGSICESERMRSEEVSVWERKEVCERGEREKERKNRDKEGEREKEHSGNQVKYNGSDSGTVSEVEQHRVFQETHQMDEPSCCQPRADEYGEKIHQLDGIAGWKRQEETPQVRTRDLVETVMPRDSLGLLVGHSWLCNPTDPLVPWYEIPLTLEFPPPKQLADFSPQIIWDHCIESSCVHGHILSPKVSLHMKSKHKHTLYCFSKRGKPLCRVPQH